MTMSGMLNSMSSVELSQRIALDKIRVKERERAERMAKARKH